jgi:DNA-binding NarL/FixJ family response regulator
MVTTVESVESRQGSTPIYVLVADDHELVRDGLKMLVQSVLENAVFLDAHDGASLLTLAAAQPMPHLALVDLNMPGMNKGERLGDLVRMCPDLPIVVVSAMTSPDVGRRALDLSSVYAFVPKSASVDHMRVAISAALRGIKLAFPAPVDNVPEPELCLSPRLEAVRALLRQGMTNKHIAAELGISEGTVKNYMTDIFRALKVSNRTQAAGFDPDKA